MIEVKAPNKYSEKGKFTIFLAGVIDQDRGEKWQSEVVKALHDYEVLILNPRRERWLSDMKQEKDNPQFREQVIWEQNGMNEADLILFVFATTPETAKDSQAPVTLLELGQHLKDKPMVCCPEGYWRKGNVDLMCELYGIKVYKSLDALLDKLKKRLDVIDLYEKWNATNHRV